MKKLRYFLLLYLILLLSSLNAEGINKYDINFELLQSGELNISEKILYDFGLESKHGIYRDIPYTINKNSYHRDIGINNFKVYQDNKDVDYKIENIHTKLSGKNYRIKIGEDDRLFLGKHLYQIDYSVQMGVLNKDFIWDMTSWNLVGNEWKYDILNIKAIIKLPISLSQENTIVKIYSGEFGSKTTKANIHWIDDKHFTISIDKLLAGEGLTVDIFYPKNILQQSGLSNEEETTKERFFSIWYLISIFILLIFCYKDWHKFGKDEFKFFIYPQYEPPKDLSILQSGLIYNKFANNIDYIPAIIELAQQGYLTITKTSQDILPPSVYRTKKDSSDLSDDMRFLLDKVLFSFSRSFVFKSYFYDSQARKLNNGYDWINKKLYKWSYFDDFMQRNPKKKRDSFLFRFMILSIIILSISTYISISLFGLYITKVSIINLMIISIFTIVLFLPNIMPHTILIFLLIFSQFIISASYTSYSLVSILHFISMIIVSILLIFPNKFLRIMLILGVLYIQSLLLDEYSSYTFFQVLSTPVGVGIVIIFLAFFIYSNIGQYSLKGAKSKSDLDGFSLFISKVSKDQILRELKKDPLYLERYLPYAILFGYSKSWLSFYTSLDLTPPTWYDGDIYTFSVFLKDVNKSSIINGNLTMSSGIGTFAGGGMGGGGGGSW